MGRAWIFGDNIDTDVLAPGYLMKLPPDELARHCLEAVDPAFASQVRPGDIVIAGRNFGLGSSREQAAVSLKLLGVRAILAASFARIFFRNAINLGLPALRFDNQGRVAAGESVEIDFAAGSLLNATRGERHDIEKLPDDLLTIIAAGGLMPLLKRRLG